MEKLVNSYSRITIGEKDVSYSLSLINSIEELIDTGQAEDDKSVDDALDEAQKFIMDFESYAYSIGISTANTTSMILTLLYAISYDNSDFRLSTEIAGAFVTKFQNYSGGDLCEFSLLLIPCQQVVNTPTIDALVKKDIICDDRILIC